MLKLINLQRLAQQQSQTLKSEEWKPWEPNPGPQTEALNSLADVLGYGGAAGGGKSGLTKILAVTNHQRSIIFRREYPRLKDLIEKSRKLLAYSGAKYNSNEKVWRDIPGNRFLEFGACQHENNIENWRGIEHDLKAVDEATEITLEMFLFLTGWCRSPDPHQRCRTVFTFNPPSSSKGRWVVNYLAPWLDPTYPKKTGREIALPGELRYFVGDGKDLDIEVEVSEFVVKIGDEIYEFNSPEPQYINDKIYWPRPKPMQIGSELLEPRSRTFIAARLEDNPFLRDSGYRSVLQSLPEPLRSQLLYGDTKIQQDDSIWQVIPTAWVEAAMERWLPYPQALEQTHLGVDVARGGKDFTIIAERYANWIAELHYYPGQSTPDGIIVAKQIFGHLKAKNTKIQIDVIGVGAAVVDCCTKDGLKTIPLQSSGAAVDSYSKEPITDVTGLLTFLNKRALWWWNMRELLNPANNTLVALPKDAKLKEDLTAPRWSESGKVIKVESKDDIIKRLGHSTDRGDAVIYAFADFSRYNPSEWMRKL